MTTPSKLKTKWSCLAGVQFPNSIRRKKFGVVIESGKPNTKHWLTTRQAAEMLGLSKNSTLIRFKKSGFQRRVFREGGGIKTYWRLRDVKKSAAEHKTCVVVNDKKANVIDYIPDGYVGEDELMKRIGCDRSALSRLVKQGVLSAKYVKITGRKAWLVCPEEEIPEAAAIVEENRAYHEWCMRRNESKNK